MSQIDEFKKSVKNYKTFGYRDFDKLVSSVYGIEFKTTGHAYFAGNESYIKLRIFEKETYGSAIPAPDLKIGGDFNWDILLYDLCIKGALEWNTDYLVLISW